MLVPDEGMDIVVNDLILRALPAHLWRLIGSNLAKQEWCERVSMMEIDMLCPQHGAIYQGEDVNRFIDWFDQLEVGVV